MNCKIVVACHKPCDVPSSELYIPVHVGSEGKESFGYVTDNTGENISSKNPVFCELTGLYWAWKNLDYDHLGLVHYRRYFTLKNKSYRRQHGELASVLTVEECENLLKRYDIVVPKKRHYYIETLYSHYSHTFSEDHLRITRDIIQMLFPEYLDSFDKTMQQRSAYIFNMFIMPKKLTDDYFSWLFPILFELEKNIDISNLTPFEARYAGRISERLFNVWLNKRIADGTINRNSIGEIPYLYVGKIDWSRKIKSFLAAKLFNKKYEESF